MDQSRAARYQQGEGYYLGCDYQSTAYMWEAASIGMCMAVRYCVGALGKSRFTSPRAWTLLNKYDSVLSVWSGCSECGYLRPIVVVWLNESSIAKFRGPLVIVTAPFVPVSIWTGIFRYCLFRQEAGRHNYQWMRLPLLYQRHTSTACSEVSDDGLSAVDFPH